MVEASWAKPFPSADSGIPDVVRPYTCLRHTMQTLLEGRSRTQAYFHVKQDELSSRRYITHAWSYRIKKYSLIAYAFAKMRISSREARL